ncbi:AfsR/SARP family transcriptional regulator [Streptomyces rapamycinicus]|uniref:SARP family transcriptional regulator n=2 Tax=Streptomyces rapamycinicus TaxID=1226757 RepID=A0A3L8RQC9_STRRN|nr:BTAD domain-containing putative transcriptional regulator [Streptomyces rapamycinicus]MBB4783343.1 DNA-binding SARP family transcriptional activator [Streptomyces rapamycinicus]RLV81182.1 SARP family transcriptional regulator [Streptomyces rapamycinicus NRRL 5491]UTO63749.1 winged helix-turn-helix domain-containing protein [Streptomyces rapamycinicus]UTP31703.1 winged helix-turn-helix domain-containing protein [Streptomyces rapamycinicus NRRL 5491]
MRVGFGVLGPVVAWDADAGGRAIALKGPRHREVLARLIVARRRVVPVSRLIEDLWAEPPPGAVGAVRTFVAALRRALEPQRPPRTPARLLVTEGPGYALRADPDAVDAWRFERDVAAAATLPPDGALPRLEEALSRWRGPAYAEFADEGWARGERSRLAELRLHAVERQAEARLALGRAAEAVPDLEAHLAEHPWREGAWRALALALYRTGRQGDALAVLRRARSLLVEQLGVDPGPELRRLETDILGQAPHLDPAAARGGAAAQVWADATAAYDRAVASGARTRLESTAALLRDLSMTGGGGLLTARRQRVTAVAAAEELGDPELTARVIGAYDVPAIWTRLDDPEQAASIVRTAERTLAALAAGSGPVGHDAIRARLLATIAVESRGGRSERGRQAARQAEEIARRLDDPGLLAFALNGVFMQSFERAGLAPRRDATGAELIALAARHGLVAFEVLGHLIRLQARGALGDFAAADRHAAAAERLGERHERPLVGVFTAWYRALRLAATGRAAEAVVEVADEAVAETTDQAVVETADQAAAEATDRAAAEVADEAAVEAAYRDAAARLDGAGMPGLERGLPQLALLCLRVERGRPAPTDADLDWGPYAPWARPLVLLAQDRRAEAAAALREVPEPPRDLLLEALWCLTGQAAIAVGDRETIARAHAALTPAAAELAGAGSGLLTLGPVSRHLADLAEALR